MSGTSKPLPEWTQGYALIRDRIATYPAPGLLRSVAQDGNDVEILRFWPSETWLPDSNISRLIFLGPPNATVSAGLKAASWSETATMALLASQPEDVEQVVKLPETSTLFEAPMNDYDVVEVTDFDRPVARGRMHYGSMYGLLSDPHLYSPSDPDSARRAILANFAGAAYSHGLPWILLVASEDHADHLANGWSKATNISIWQQN